MRTCLPCHIPARWSSNANRIGPDLAFGFVHKRSGNEIKLAMDLIRKQEKEILFEATRRCVWLKLDVCRMRVRFATQQRDTSGLINHQVKYFGKADSAFTIFLHRRHGRFIVYQFKILRSQSVYHLRCPRLPPSYLLLPRPDSISAERSN